MTSAQHQLWINRGKPFRMSRPLGALTNRLRAYGYTVGTIGNDAHLDAQPPEDHTPYSETGWPVASPYGTCNAGDLMPGPANLPNWREIMHQMYLDKQAGYGPAQFVKYVNRELPGTTTCVQDSWKPSHVRRSSGDRGHGHFSGRSDMVDSTSADSYDPVARYLERTGGGIMATLDGDDLLAIEKLIRQGTNVATTNVVNALCNGSVWDGYLAGLAAGHPLKGLQAPTERYGLMALRSAVNAIPAPALPPGFAQTVATLVTEAILTELDPELDDQLATRVVERVLAGLAGLQFVPQRP